MIDLSVIIVNYNVRHFLEQCLNSVKKASENIRGEIIVVDNNSADGSCSMVSAGFPDVVLIRNNFNAGFSAACNQAIKISGGKFILLLNPDTVVEEDTFTKCLAFMNSHPEAGALGVKMINGSGKFLPESKRSLPTPPTAFYKMAGLSGLFPRSRTFNRYYLGHISSNETAEAEVLSGAFMFLRREAIDKTGLLDETFFMYGEDIDLSYRILKAGYKNYYYPDVRIIHYKGESTRKGDLNYIVHFYRAMLIFTDKHSGGKRNVLFHFIIRSAIYFWGIIALLKTVLRKYLLPFADAAIIVLLFIFIIKAWGSYRFGGDYDYPGLFRLILIPAYTLITMISIAVSGGYRIPSRIGKVIRGIMYGSAIVLVIYALLPQDLRFSRAVLVLGSLSALFFITLQRILFALTGMRLVYNPFAGARKVIIISNAEDFGKISRLIGDTHPGSEICGRVCISYMEPGTEVLGNIDQIKEIIRVNGIDEVIFSAGDLTASQIIGTMQLISETNVTIKLSSPDGKLLIGSNYVTGNRK